MIKLYTNNTHNQGKLSLACNNELLTHKAE